MDLDAITEEIQQLKAIRNVLLTMLFETDDNGKTILNQRHGERYISLTNELRSLLKNTDNIRGYDRVLKYQNIYKQCFYLPK